MEDEFFGEGGNLAGGDDEAFAAFVLEICCSVGASRMMTLIGLRSHPEFLETLRIAA